MSIHNVAEDHIAYLEECTREEEAEYIAARQAAASVPPSEMTACPICKRTYVIIGRSIHYCQDRRDARGAGEYVAHFDNQQVGHSYDTYLQAEEALDDYGYWLRETSLVGALGVSPDDLPEPPSLNPDDVMDPRD